MNGGLVAVFAERPGAASLGHRGFCNGAQQDGGGRQAVIHA
ncbi:hypothetical protein SNOG_00173 [Parastagonospora nodorum SN15]|uniref:Uncharacterized protein n=1 Tax=Phaeosphaeria nodorum (strain SN15 / ATCC MYA-4574 / FGSC 10173) TaxID=321614 RepID=Q0V741_PHANO|nr:hypothetical protein SNOG_00173 [Parastagonospora nodorum SN15]EAT91668.1 hypothetical protein SNOG_00173 [Parastagonospora nodorum SN15]